ncbi:MAG: ABC transporter permease [Chloroflexi bacterium]|nr:ABC transporter permease [Chloroflexota bacterium]
MHRYIIRRLIYSLPALVGVSILVFMMVRLVPGDVILAQIGEAGYISESRLQEFRAQLGLDAPFHEQYLRWMGGMLFKFDLGKSLWTGEPVIEEIKRKLPVTAELALMALVISIFLSLPLGIISAVRRDTPLDYFSRMVAISGLSLPDFWLGTLVVVFSAIWFKWLPPIGYLPFFDDPWGNIQQFLLPAVVLGVRLSAVGTRMTRSTMLEVLREDYIRTAWAKGLRERMVIVRHALKNAMIPVITIMGGQLRFLLGGTVIIESIFALPGVGRLTLDSIIKLDYPQTQANVMFAAVVVIALNLIVDLTYSWFDPRIRYE